MKAFLIFLISSLLLLLVIFFSLGTSIVDEGNILQISSEINLKETAKVEAFVSKIMKALESDVLFDSHIEKLIYQNGVEPRSVSDFEKYLKPFIGASIDKELKTIKKRIVFPQIEGQILSMSIPPTHVLNIYKNNETKDEKIKASIYLGKVSGRYFISILNREITKIYDTGKGHSSYENIKN